MLAMTPLIPFRPDALGAELVRLRNDVHLSQSQLGRLADVSNTAISDLEAGTAPAPHPLMLQKIATGLATSGSGAVDEKRAADTYLALMRAAGYMPPAVEPVEEATLRNELFALGYSHDEAPVVDRLVVDLASRSLRQRRQILKLMGDAIELTDPNRTDDPAH